MTLEEMRERKRELGYTNEMISELSGVPLGTVQKIFAGVTKRPRRDTVTALEGVLGRRDFMAAGSGRDTGCQMADNGGDTGYPMTDSRSQDLLREGSAAYHQDTSSWYTIDDYYALPEERRVELIDGQFYDMAAPSVIHQVILGEMYAQFYLCMEKHPECRLLFAPFDVRLDRDNYTMVQPDLMIICREGLNRRRMEGAPDFIVEILSPSNRSHDMFRKLSKYHHAGVREYWIVDPKRRVVIVYDLEHDEPPVIYSFESSIPVGISGGQCAIDFSRIYQKVKEYLD